LQATEKNEDMGIYTRYMSTETHSPDSPEEDGREPCPSLEYFEEGTASGGRRASEE